VKVRGARRWFLAAAVAFTSAGCRCQRERPPEPGPDVSACVAACSALVAAGCLFEGTPGDEQGRCAAACSQRSLELRPAGCENERRAYLEYARFKACIAPCLHAGTAHVGHQAVTDAGATRDVQTELVRAGCQKCSGVKPGAGAGSPCQTHSVCAQSCCRCPSGKAWFTARTCADGECVSGSRACELGRLAAPVDPCAAPGHSR
jgi:hypothetical protein